MLVHREVYEHPTQASRVRLNVYDYQPGPESVAGLGPRERGFMVTEDRAGAVTVVSSLGFFATREEALERVRRRAEELRRQSYRAVSTAA